MAYRIGLDVGITSVGWALLEMETNEHGKRQPYKIRDLGVRMFDAAEDNEKGASLAMPRRMARSMRRRLRRHQHRVLRVKQLFEQSGIMSFEEIIRMYSARGSQPDVYELRTAGLDRILTRDELVRVFIHLIQRRGFKSNRKAEAEEKEAGKLIVAVSDNAQRMKDGGYRSVGEMFYLDQYFKYKRNKAEDYSHTVGRNALIDEVKAIFESQMGLGNQLVTPSFVQKYTDIFCSQRNFDDGPGGNSPYGGDMISKMVGQCTFEEDEKRAPKSSYTFEKFNLLSKVQNLRIYRRNRDSRISSLSAEEKTLIVELAYKKSKLTYGQLRTALELEEADYFKGLTYSSKKSMEDTEKSTFITLPFYHEVKKLLKNSQAQRIEDLEHSLLDDIGVVLSIYKNDSNRLSTLREIGVRDGMREALLPITAGKFGHLSLKAMRNIIPHLEAGLDYDKACAAAGYEFRGHSRTEKTVKLPAINSSRITNPVVNRALSQSVKVINAIVDKYGSPESIHIELTREMSRDFQERKSMQKSQMENQQKNERIKNEIQEMLGVTTVAPKDIVKFKLFMQQQEMCIYSGQTIERSRLFEPGYAEVDHIIPYSLSFDDGYKNKVLVKTSENRQKGNRTPLEYLRSAPERLHRFKVLVESMSLPTAKKNNLLRDVPEDEIEREEFRQRNLQDTRYITAELASHIRDHLLFDESMHEQSKRVVCVNGPVTAYMRRRWGLQKNRGAGDLHHAQDAVVIACVDDVLIHRISTYDKFKKTYLSDSKRFIKHFDPELKVYQYVDQKTGEIYTWNTFDEENLIRKDNGFPTPWRGFREEVLARLSVFPMQEIKLLGLPCYETEEHIRSIFVSRMPNRKISGEVHKETIRSPKLRSEGLTVSKVELKKLKYKNGEIQNYYNPGDDRILYQALCNRLEQFDGNAEMAFSEPFYKVSNDRQTQTLVKKVKITEKTTLGVIVHKGNGYAANGSMVRIDVFEKEDKNYIVPIYTSDVIRFILPNRAITAHKRYEEWRVVDESFLFKFSLYPNDLIHIRTKQRVALTLPDGHKRGLVEDLLYYKNANISTGAITVKSHDDYGVISSLGVQNLLIFDKYVVDYLGQVSRVKNEIRQGFGKKSRGEISVI